MKKQKLAPILSRKQKEGLVHTLEPYLKSGLSIRNACLQSGIPRSTLYKIIGEDEYLRNRVDQYRQYISVVTMNILSRKLFFIAKKQQAGVELDSDDLRFVQWLAVHSGHCREEFGKEARNKPTFDPQAELLRINQLIEDNSVGFDYDSQESL
jgi:hypothetical protein